MASLRIATRGSRLALWQAERVAALLGGDVELVIVSTTGDQRTDVPIWTIGGTGVFVKEVQQAVLDGRADLAVHSAKDLPSETADRLRAPAGPARRPPARRPVRIVAGQHRDPHRQGRRLRRRRGGDGGAGAA